MILKYHGQKQAKIQQKLSYEWHLLKYRHDNSGQDIAIRPNSHFRNFLAAIVSIGSHLTPFKPISTQSPFNCELHQSCLWKIRLFSCKKDEIDPEKCF